MAIDRAGPVQPANTTIEPAGERFDEHRRF
jgi:hypothetical protein